MHISENRKKVKSIFFQIKGPYKNYKIQIASKTVGEDKFSSSTFGKAIENRVHNTITLQLRAIFFIWFLKITIKVAGGTPVNKLVVSTTREVKK